MVWRVIKNAVAAAQTVAPTCWSELLVESLVVDLFLLEREWISSAGSIHQLQQKNNYVLNKGTIEINYI